jgi:hypothetical protein
MVHGAIRKENSKIENTSSKNDTKLIVRIYYDKGK